MSRSVPSHPQSRRPARVRVDRSRAAPTPVTEDERVARVTVLANLTWACLFSLAVAAAFAAGPASAQYAASVDDRFASWDGDKNDLLTLDEYRAEARAEFDDMDDDRNGSITAAEMEEADPQSDGEMSTAQKIALRDTNEDGILSLDEHEASVEARFEEIDANDDDNIGRDELKSPWSVPTPTP